MCLVVVSVSLLFVVMCSSSLLVMCFSLFVVVVGSSLFVVVGMCSSLFVVCSVWFVDSCPCFVSALVAASVYLSSACSVLLDSDLIPSSVLVVLVVGSVLEVESPWVVASVMASPFLVSLIELQRSAEKKIKQWWKMQRWLWV